MTSEATYFCRAIRGYTLAYRDAERLGRPATESVVKVHAGELVFQRLVPIKFKGVGHFRGNFRAAAPASFGVHWGRDGTRVSPSGYDSIDGLVITACDVPGAMNDRVVQLCGVTEWPEIEQGSGVALKRRRQGGAPGN